VDEWTEDFGRLAIRIEMVEQNKLRVKIGNAEWCSIMGEEVLLPLYLVLMRMENDRKSRIEAKVV
jgi:hypothetical protein